MSNVVGEAVVEVRPDTSGFRGATQRQVSTAGRDAGRTFGRSFAGGLTAGLGVAAIGVALARELRGVVTAASEQETATIRLQRALRNTGAEAELFGRSISDILTEMAFATGFTDEELAAGFSRIVTVTRDSEKAIRDVEIAMDVARQTGRSFESVALAIARAEGGTVTSLQRLGVVLPAHIKDLKAAERGTAALTILQRRFRGAAEDFAEGTEGSFLRLSFAIDELKEAIGFALTPSLKQAADGLREFVSDEQNVRRVQETVTETVRVTKNIVGDLVSAFRDFKAVIGPVVDAVGGLDEVLKLAFGIALLRRLALATAAMTTFGKAAQAAALSAGAATAAGTAGGVGRAGRLGSLLGRGGGLLPATAVVGGFVAGQEIVERVPGLERGLRDLGGAINDFVSGGIESSIAEIQESDAFIRARRDQLLRELHERQRTTEVVANREQRALQRLVRARREAADAADEQAAAETTERAPARPGFALRRLRLEARGATLEPLLRERAAFLQRTIDEIEQAGIRGKNDRARLEALYGELIATTGEIDGIEREAAAAREEAAQRRRERLEREREEARQEAEDAKERKRLQNERRLERIERGRSLREARLQNRVARAELTETETDDRRALRALARFYTQQRNIFRRRRGFARAEAAEASRLGVVQQLRGLGERAGGGDGGSIDFFQTAIQDFRQFGSNIATTPGGILSPQDTRGALAATGLARTAARGGPDQVAQGVITLVGATVKQTDVLAEIAQIIRAAWGVPRGNTVEKPKTKQGARNTAIADLDIFMGGPT